MVELTADEAAVYDRQLRVWGLETQQKLRQSKVLIVGCTGLAAEVAKNIILAGVGSVTLVDDTPCSASSPGNFLVPHDAKDKTVAEACVATLQEMNPLVSVNAVAGTPGTFVSTATVSGYNIVILVGQSGAVVDAADVACRETNVPLIAACSRGLAGWAFANVHSHTYIKENKTDQSDGTTKKTTEVKSVQGVSWEAALGAPVEKRQMKRMSPFLPLLRVCMRFERIEGRSALSSDYAVLEPALLNLCKVEGHTGGSVDGTALGSFLESTEEMPAINAILGGVVANDTIKIVASKGEPVINNIFMYSLLEGGGWVERLGPRFGGLISLLGNQIFIDLQDG
ncbi:hypothetical protein Ndes2526A_g07814 [Nannochloris sp. 'desiccata']